MPLVTATVCRAPSRTVTTIGVDGDTVLDPLPGVTLSRTGTIGALAFSSRSAPVLVSALAELGAEPPTVAAAAATPSVPRITLRRSIMALAIEGSGVIDGRIEDDVAEAGKVTSAIDLFVGRARRCPYRRR
ncbi:hypothetical protein Ate02nite_54450 [Paractinoplanes tereljensis]|uniref:Uncharacterized protein n=1 Tax=Paractinoplanes tereljensis TaxID=571912 RepID=A0A919TVW3_9ACTN|nr:hypothetical protein Ate02nite_54450 [Actinoplanes tereljensis]